MKIRPGNIPLPEPFIAALLVGALLHLLVPLTFPPPSPAWILPGILLFIAGAAGSAWAVLAARDDDMAHSPRLLTAGPYAFSRNPMYLGWLLITLGLALLLRSAWLVFTTLGAVFYLHAVTIPAEERELQQRFGAAYETYRNRVRRWL